MMTPILETAVTSQPKHDAVLDTRSPIIATYTDELIDAPLTWKTVLIGGIAAFAGIFLGYDSAVINGVLGMPYFIHEFTNMPYPGPHASFAELNEFVIPTRYKSLIVGLLAVGNLLGSFLAGDIADLIGRRFTIVFGCLTFCIGAVLQTAATEYGLLLTGRVIGGLGMGLSSGVTVLYLSEVSPRRYRGAFIAALQLFIAIGLLTASCVTYGTKGYADSGSYRIPLGVQIVWAVVLAVAITTLPETPRYLVARGRIEDASMSLQKLRSQPRDSSYVQQELAEIIANYNYELRITPQRGPLEAWRNCFRGKLSVPSSNLRRTIVAIGIQMFQQTSGINFIFYFGTTFFIQLDVISNPFLVTLILSLIDLCSTPISFYLVERFGRRPLLLYGGAGMALCEFLVAIIGTADGKNKTAIKGAIAMICLFVFFFATTWGPGAWVVAGEIFPIPIRSRGVALGNASNWLWNCVIAIITPYMVDTDRGDLGVRVFFIWGSMNVCALLFAYFLVPETKGLSLEQIGVMLAETTPRTSSGWKPKSIKQTLDVTSYTTDKRHVVAECIEDVAAQA